MEIKQVRCWLCGVSFGHGKVVVAENDLTGTRTYLYGCHDCTTRRDGIRVLEMKAITMDNATEKRP
jgi:hypothetical protein